MRWNQTLLLLAFLGMGLGASAQEPKDMPFRIVEEMPEFPGGTDSLYSIIHANIIYPEKARKDSIVGTVHVQFVVSTNGEVRDVEVLRSPHPILTEAAIDAVKTLPPWKPGHQKGKPVPVYYNLPIRFALN